LTSLTTLYLNQNQLTGNPALHLTAYTN
jgi:hypothetical protein